MSANFGGSSHDTQEVELNITSIIDCFTVLITFMLASASFLSIGFFETSTNVGSEGKAAPPPIEITVRLKGDSSYLLKVTGKVSKEQTFQKEAQDSLMNELKALKASWPAVTTIALTSDDDVVYKTVIESMDKIRKQIPNVLFADL